MTLVEFYHGLVQAFKNQQKLRLCWALRVSFLTKSFIRLEFQQFAIEQIHMDFEKPIINSLKMKKSINGQVFFGWGSKSRTTKCRMTNISKFKKNVNRDSHIASSPISQCFFFKGVRCLILASSQRKLHGYIEFL